MDNEDFFSFTTDGKLDHRESKGTPEKTSTSASLTTLKPLTVWVTKTEKFLKRWNTRPPYLSPENLNAGQEATARTRHGTMDHVKTGKGVRQGCILSPHLFNFDGLPRWLSGKESACDAGDVENTDSIPGLGKLPGEGNGNPFWYSCLENPMDRGAWWAIVHGVARVRHNLATEHICMPAEYVM